MYLVIEYSSRCLGIYSKLVQFRRTMKFRQSTYIVIHRSLVGESQVESHSEVSLLVT
jgi:hypothetical protein